MQDLSAYFQRFLTVGEGVTRHPELSDRCQDRF